MRKMAQIEMPDGNKHCCVMELDEDLVTIDTTKVIIADSAVDYLIGHTEKQVVDFCRKKKWKITYPHQNHTRSGDVYMKPGR